MSKHHNYRNYNTMSNRVDEAVPVEVKDEIVEVIEEAIANEEVDVDEAAACDEPVVEEVVTDEPTPAEPLVGVVSGCAKLNIRTAASKIADIVTVVNEGTVLMIDGNVPVAGWFKVYTETGIEGYCMEQFVEIRS